ncbi:MAG: UPF0175 family protein [Chitinophagales bacterium]
MILEIEDQFTAHLSEQELKEELAIQLYKSEKISAGKAARLSNLQVQSFYEMLAKRKISVNYDVEEYKIDLESIKTLIG